MPRLLSFNGIIIYIYFMDFDFHSLPHFHVKYGEFNASVGLDGTLLSGSIPSKQLRVVQQLAKAYEKEFKDAWDKAANGENFSQIKVDKKRVK